MFSFSAVRLSGLALGCSAIALLLGAPGRAQVVYDAQVPFNVSGLASALTNPDGIAVTSTGVVYVADVESSTSGRVIQITPSGSVGGSSGTAGSLTSNVAVLSSPGIARPTAVAVDSNGDLFVADYKNDAVVEIVNPGAGNQAVTNLGYSGSNPTALALDSNNNLYVADPTAGNIYEFTAGKFNALGIQSGLEPVGLTIDPSGNVYFASYNTNELYEYTAGVTSQYGSGTFEFSSASQGVPIGMGIDPSGAVYVLDSAANKMWQVIGSTSTYQVPFSGITGAGSMAVGSTGNLYFTDYSGKAVNELFFNNNPVNFGAVTASTRTPTVTLNYNFISQQNGVSFFQTVGGDVTGEFIAPAANPCLNINPSNGADTGISAGTQCDFTIEANYLVTNPGLRSGVFGVTNWAGQFFTVPVTGTSQAAALALYPGTQTILSQATRQLYEPQQMAITGNGGTLFIADEGGVFTGSQPTYTNGGVWAYPVTAGVISSTPAQIGNFSAPISVAVNGAGDLFVGTYGLTGSGSVIEVTPIYSNGTLSWAGGTQTTLNLSALLNHPMALAFDNYGNLFIADSGPAGTNATASNPGYIIEVPANGQAAFKLPMTGFQVVFPDALAFDSNNNLWIADGGSITSSAGYVDVRIASTGVVSNISFGAFGPLNGPSGLAFDAAGDLYVLDGFSPRILVAPVTGTASAPVVNSQNIVYLGGTQGGSGMSYPFYTPADLVVWPNSQTITVDDIGYDPGTQGGTPTAVVTLQSTNASVNPTNTGVAPMTVTGYDVGNEPITFSAPVYGGADPSAYTLNGCGGSAGGTLDEGVGSGSGNLCTSTVTYTGAGTDSGSGLPPTVTLEGNIAADGSALGNVINITYGIATTQGGGDSTTKKATVIVTNTGTGYLNIIGTSITNLVGTARITGGTCTTTNPAPVLAPNASCTVDYIFEGNLVAGATLNIQDDSGGVPSTQSIGIDYTAGFKLVTTPGGPGSGGLLNRPKSHATRIGPPHAALNSGGNAGSNPISNPVSNAASNNAQQPVSSAPQQTSTDRVQTPASGGQVSDGLGGFGMVPVAPASPTNAAPNSVAPQDGSDPNDAATPQNAPDASAASSQNTGSGSDSVSTPDSSNADAAQPDSSAASSDGDHSGKGAAKPDTNL